MLRLHTEVNAISPSTPTANQCRHPRQPQTGDRLIPYLWGHQIVCTRQKLSFNQGTVLDKRKVGIDAYLGSLSSFALAYTCNSARQTLYKCYDKERYRLDSKSYVDCTKIKETRQDTGYQKILKFRVWLAVVANADKWTEVLAEPVEA